VRGFERSFHQGLDSMFSSVASSSPYCRETPGYLSAITYRKFRPLLLF
jgi:hypothetical protein